MDINLIDSHAHLNDNRYRDDLGKVLLRARDAGISAIVNVGFDLDSARHSVALSDRFDCIFAAVGIHPHDAAGQPDDYLQKLKSFAGHKKVVAVGEMGLDFFRNLSLPHIQEKIFREQIRLARELSLPIIVHDREAHRQVLAILKEERAGEVGGVMHCFSGDAAFARECLNLGFYISLAGPVTYKNQGSLTEVARIVPLDRLLLETDAPYLPPHPFRGQRNEPAYVLYTARQVAKLRGVDVQTVASATTDNAVRLFNLPAL